MYHTRKPTRLPGYDYSAAGYYFVTICTYNKQCILGKIVEGCGYQPNKVQLSKIGDTVRQAVVYMDASSPACRVEHSIIMPNHIHLIIKMESNEGGHRGPPLHNIIGKFKSYTTHAYGNKLWQRSFHDHIIRGEEDYLKIWDYVENNAEKWSADCYFAEG